MSSSSALISAREKNLPVTSLFTRQEIVGKGAYGAVYKGTHNATGTVVALKIIDLDTDDDDISDIQREVALLSSLRDAEKYNCTLYHGCWLHKTQLWLAMDLAAGGSIRTIMKAMPNLEERHIALVMRETLVALVYLHRQGIIHRDIKAANILLTTNGRIILCDFGVAAALQNQNKRSTFTGTPYWMAPEVIADGKLYDTKADIWSLGVTCYECATGNPPFAQYEALRAIQLIPKNPPAKLDASQPWTQPMRDFLAFCLTEDPNERMTAEDLQKTKFIKAHAKVSVGVLRELITKYSSWVNSGGIRQSIIGLEDSPSTDDSRDFGSESSWDYSPMPDESMFTYRGTNLGTDLPSEGNAPPTLTKSQRNHPLMRLFEDENAPALNAATAAKAYGLGFNINPAQPSHSQSNTNYAPNLPPTGSRPQPQVVIPNFGDASDEEDGNMTMRTARRPKASLPEPGTIRPSQAHTQLPRSTQSHSLSSTSSNSPRQRPGSPAYGRRPSSPPPPSPSLPNPNLWNNPMPVPTQKTVASSPSLPSMPLPRTTSTEERNRSRANTAPGPEPFPPMTPVSEIPPQNGVTGGVLAASPPNVRPLVRRGRSGTTSSDATTATHTRKSSASSATSPTESRMPMNVPPLPSPSGIAISPLSVPASSLHSNPSSPAAWIEGPALRPLDYSKLVLASDVHAELERTTQDLTAWLTAMDHSLASLLGQA